MFEHAVAAIGREPAKHHPVEAERVVELAAVLGHQGEGRRRWIDVARDRVGDRHRQAHRHRQRVAGHRVEPAALVAGDDQAGARGRHLGLPRQRQHALLLALDLGDVPPARGGVGRDRRPQRRPVEHRTVAVVGVLDQQAIGGERQHVDEAEAVALLDGRVHQHRPLEAVRPGEAHLLTDELLEAAGAGRALGPARVDDGRGLVADQPGGGVDHDLVRADGDRGRAGVDGRVRGGRHPGPHHLVEPRGRDRGVAAGQGAPVAREGDVVAAPALHHQRIEDRARLRADVAVVEAPGVVAAEAGITLEQGDARRRARGQGRQRDQAVLQAAPDEGQVERVHRSWIPPIRSSYARCAISPTTEVRPRRSALRSTTTLGRAGALVRRGVCLRRSRVDRARAGRAARWSRRAP